MHSKLSSTNLNAPTLIKATSKPLGAFCVSTSVTSHSSASIGHESNRLTLL